GWCTCVPTVVRSGRRNLALPIHRQHLRIPDSWLRPRLNRHLADALVAHVYDEPWAVVAMLDIVAQTYAEADASRRIGRREVAADDVGVFPIVGHTSSLPQRRPEASFCAWG